MKRLAGACNLRKVDFALPDAKPLLLARMASLEASWAAVSSSQSAEAQGMEANLHSGVGLPIGSDSSADRPRRSRSRNDNNRFDVDDESETVAEAAQRRGTTGRVTGPNMLSDGSHRSSCHR